MSSPWRTTWGRSRGGIFQTLRDAALIQQTGGGNGFSFSRLRPKNAIVFSSMGRATGPVGFLRVYDRAFGEIAQGGCLTPDTLVFTAHGLLRLDEIVDPEKPGWQPQRITVLTDQGPRISLHGYNRGRSQVLRVVTEEGLTLTGTPDHKVKVLTREGWVWRRLDELQPGDAIPVILGQHHGHLQPLKPVEKRHGNQVMPRLPHVLDEEFAFFLGYLTGDGFVAQEENDHRIGVAVANHSYLIEEMPRLMERLFEVQVHVRRRPGDGSTLFIIDNRAVKEFLCVNGLGKGRSVEASVPRLIRLSPPSVVAAYLRGLFEADGTVVHGYPMLCTASERLAREVAVLLIGLGCPVKVRPGHPSGNRFGRSRPWFVRIVSSAGLRAWAERIGCDPRSRFRVCLERIPDSNRESAYPLPEPAYWLSPVLEATALPQRDRRGRGTGRKIRSTRPALRRALLRYVRGERRLTLTAYEELTERYPEFARHAPPVGDRWFVYVRSVEPAGEALTLDLEVSDNHTYLANGMVTHNSRRGANMAVLRVDHPDIEEFITCKTDENAITNFNISVGITDAFMRAVENDEEWELRFPDVLHPAYRNFRGTLEDAERVGIPIRVYKRVRARDLFRKIATQAHHNGEPGVLFLDTANRSNPVPHLYTLEATNPCVTGDTLVATPQGWRYAAEIRTGDEICTVLGTGRVERIEVYKERPVYRVFLSDGGVIKVTAAHQFHVRDSRTKFYEPRRVDQLKPGDWVRVFPARMPNNPVPDKPPHLSDREFGFLIGVLVGDGCYTEHALSRNVVRFSTHADEEEWNAVVREAFQKLGATHFVTDVNPGSRSMMMDPKPGSVIAGWVRTLLLPPARSPEKRLPLAYINSNREFLEGLLDGLFSTDGSVDLSSNHPLLRFHTSSEELARQVRLILLMFGVHARIHRTVRKRHALNGREIRHDRPKYDVVISGASLGRFIEQIRLSHPEKRRRLEEAALRCNFTGGNWAAQVVKIEFAGYETVYDLYEPQSDTWITEGYVSRGCGEQWLGPYENCCLGSVNLARHVKYVDGRAEVDWEKLRETVEWATRFLDNVVQVNQYVPAVPQLKEAAYRTRRIGLGFMGLADLMYHLRIRYGSEEGQEFAAQIAEFIRYHAMRTSIELAKERGPFPAIRGSIYDPENLKWEPPKPLKPYTRDWGRPPLDWNAIVEGIRRYGIRNAAQTTVAPTGTLSTVAGCEGYGCEPVFALAYIRYVHEAEGRLELRYVSPLFMRALKEAGLDEEARARIIEEVLRKGTCQHIQELPDWIRHTFVVAQDLTPEEHVWMQASIQAFIDNSISKTINFPEKATIEDVEKAYILAWKLGCKGLTVYVAGSRQKEVLETLETKEKKEKKREEGPMVPTQPTLPQPVGPTVRPRPQKLAGVTYRIATPVGTAFITLNENGEGQPFEVFLNVGKAGSDIAAVAEAIGRLISLLLRLPSPVPPAERLRQVVDQLQGIGGGARPGLRAGAGSQSPRRHRPGAGGIPGGARPGGPCDPEPSASAPTAGASPGAR